MPAERPVFITSAEAICALGDSLPQCLEAWRAGKSGLSSVDGVLAGRIRDQSLLKGRRYGAASNLAVHAARRAIERAGWDAGACGDVWMFAASSRGNAGELLNAHGWRRGSKRFRASNTMHSEIAAAVSIELGLTGPWQMIANGCSAGLDALGLAWMALRSGVAKRALVVAVDLPLVPELLRDFQVTRLLSAAGLNDPLAPGTNGFIPGEAAAAVTLECRAEGPNFNCEMITYSANSDAYDSIVIPQDGGPLSDLLSGLGSARRPALICPHATGTANHAVGEVNALRRAFGEDIPPLLLLKPFTGHALGASGLLDIALMAGAMGGEGVPGNLEGLSAPPGITLPVRFPVMRGGDDILKIASGMGGHNAAVLLRKAGQ